MSIQMTLPNIVEIEEEPKLPEVTQEHIDNMLDTILTIIQLAPWVISGASLICALTPTPKDDQIIGKIYKLIDWCAINVGRAKEK